MRRFSPIFAAGVGLVLSMLVGGARAYTIDDHTDSHTYNGQNPGTCCHIPSWTDVVGAKGGLDNHGNWRDGFDVKGIEVVFGGASLTFQVYTNMPQGGIGSGASKALPGAIFLDPARTLSTTGNANQFSLAVKLNADAGGGVGLYDVSAYNLSRDKWGVSPLAGHYIYGGQFRDNRCAGGSVGGGGGIGNCTGYDVPVSIKTGVIDNTVTTSVNWHEIDSTTKYRIDVTLDNLAPNQLRTFDLLWAAGDCGNDVIWGGVTEDRQVPEPASAALFLVGLAGLAFGGVRMRRRQHRG